jgi:hypothetical protein
MRLIRVKELIYFKRKDCLSWIHLLKSSGLISLSTSQELKSTFSLLFCGSSLWTGGGPPVQVPINKPTRRAWVGGDGNKKVVNKSILVCNFLSMQDNSFFFFLKNAQLPLVR